MVIEPLMRSSALPQLIQKSRVCADYRMMLFQVPESGTVHTGGDPICFLSLSRKRLTLAAGCLSARNATILVLP